MKSYKYYLNEGLLDQTYLSSAEYQKAKKMKGFSEDDYTWDGDQQLYKKKDANEAKIEDPEILASIDEFYDLQQEIESLNAKLKEAKAKFGKYSKYITPLLDAMKDTGDKLAETDDYVIKIKRFAHERSSASYKDAFEMAISKVNAATQAVLNKALEESKKISKIGHSFEIDVNEGRLDENIFTDAIKGIKMVVKSFLSLFKRESKNIDDGNSMLKRLVEDMKDLGNVNSLK